MLTRQAARWRFHSKLAFLALSDFSTACFTRTWTDATEADEDADHGAEEGDDSDPHWKKTPLTKSFHTSRVAKDAGAGVVTRVLVALSTSMLLSVFLRFGS